MSKIYYKVVSKSNHNSNFTSAFSINKYKLCYAINVPTRTINGTPLFIFDSLDAALSYAHKDDLVFECTATKVRKPYNLTVSVNAYFTTYWNIVKRARKNHKNIINALKKELDCTDKRLWTPFKGTLWCDSVTLRKQIQKEIN